MQGYIDDQQGESFFFNLNYLRMMKWFLCVIVFGLFLPFYASAQFSDDFSDGNLDAWDGDTNHFIINSSEQLQLNAPSGSTLSWIHTLIPFTDSMSWDLYFHLAFAPSTSNQLRIYLGLNGPDYSVASGYYLEIGASGDQDAIELKYLDAGTSQTIASSPGGSVAFEPVMLKIRVIKNANGLWQCFNTSEAIPELLFSTMHDLQPLSSLNTFGIYCKYTDTRRDKFFFDDINIQPLLADTSPPVWLSVSVINDHSLTLIFNEAVNPLSASQFSNYILTPGNVSPDEIIVNGNELVLSWAQSFVSQQEYTLSVSNIRDLAGNTMDTEARSFFYLQIDTAEMFDMLVTEIMADPTPVIGLPDAEYLEIFNPSTKIFDLSDHKIKIGTSERILPDSILLPGQYVIVTDDSNVNALSGFGRIIVIENMPALTNSGTSVTLLNNNNDIIHELNYTDEWYQDPSKSDGGWSLEMINPLHICTEEENWAAADNLQGGTPGSENSQWNIVPDASGPKLISVFTSSDNIVELRFDEKLDLLYMQNENIYDFNPSLDILSVDIINANSVSLQLSIPLEEGVIYYLYPFEASDCLGNIQLTEDTIVFGLVSDAQEGDVLINEILFNPASGGSRYIEIINASEKFISLSDLAVGRITSAQTEIFGLDIQEILAPGLIAVITPDPADILARYHVPQPSLLFESDLPAWDEKSDHAAIISAGVMIDSFTYSSSWHHPVIADQNGVSLERLSIFSETSNPSNWHSASSLSGFGTPTGPNSQMIPIIDQEPPYTITNRNFSPNDDGFNDFLLIRFEHGNGNDVGSIWVYDLEGREIHQVLTNESLGNSSIIQWDGRNTAGEIADMGIYLIYMQLWDADGNVKEYQESCALVKR